MAYYSLGISLVLICAFGRGLCSLGDRSYFYAKCAQGCIKQNCSLKDDVYISKVDVLPEASIIFTWECDAECGYQCMWLTTQHFIDNQLNIPQFFGKWPFYRFLGMQEPASVLFSIMNLVVHCIGIWKFRQKVRSESPLYYVWQVFCVICCNGWLWSIVFHTRDFPLTEFLDYTFAYSIVLANFNCMILRMVQIKSNRLKSAISVGLFAFYLNHVNRLRSGRFDYDYNMMANVITGVLTGVGWLVWGYRNKGQCNYVWKVCYVQLLAGCSLLLELMDFPPFWFTFDAHSLWHLCTAPLTVLFYSFIIDDCKHLQEQHDSDEELRKLI